jgi:putative membrane protein
MADAPPKLTEQQRYLVKLALDRTMLAWIRTALALASFGFALVAFFRTLRYLAHNPETIRLHLAAVRSGEVLLALAIIAMVLSALSYERALRRLRRGETPALRPWSLSLAVGIVIAMMALVGLWLILTNGPVGQR